ncbi:MAG: hypothetical protein E3J76_03710 [Candidatus Aminicenantes bacterium]|nr:MAG: hypothetical protein E3J76_03710 [Candidatus Aminicenantes bacterium]
MSEFFTIQELGTLREIMDRTWQEVGAELAEVVGSPATRDSVFEICTDRMNDFAGDAEEKRLVGKFLSLPYKRMQDLKVELLPMEFYE